MQSITHYYQLHLHMISLVWKRSVGPSTLFDGCKLYVLVLPSILYLLKHYFIDMTEVNMWTHPLFSICPSDYFIGVKGVVGPSTLFDGCKLYVMVLPSIMYHLHVSPPHPTSPHLSSWSSFHKYLRVFLEMTCNCCSCQISNYHYRAVQ